jgi:hypothetical protein
MLAALKKDSNSNNLSLSQDLENNTFLGMDLKFYKQIHQSNCGKGYIDPEWQILRQESDGSFAVAKGGLTLHIIAVSRLTRTVLDKNSVPIRFSKPT